METLFVSGIVITVTSLVLMLFSLSVKFVLEFTGFPSGLGKLSRNEKQYPVWKSPECNTSKQLESN